MKNIILILAFSILGYSIFNSLTPISFFYGKPSDVTFTNDVVTRYLNSEKASSQRSVKTRRIITTQYVYKNIIPTSRANDRICFLNYGNIKFGDANEFRKMFPNINYQKHDSLLIVNDDDSFCVKESSIISISNKDKTWNNLIL